MTTYTGPDRRAEGQRVVINAVRNGAQEDVEQLLAIAHKIAGIAEFGTKWLRRVGIILALGFISFVFSVGMWYMKVNDHIARDESLDSVQDDLIHTMSQRQAQTVGVLEGIDRRLVILEERAE